MNEHEHEDEHEHDRAPAEARNRRDELHARVAEFRAWSDALGTVVEERYGEWECDYLAWPALHAAVIAFFDELPPTMWLADDTNALLYAIARDNEIEHLVRAAAKLPATFKALAEASAAGHGDWNARWQLADRLPSIAPDVAIEALLLRFVRDEHEYVRRRALFALGRMQSPHAESLAVAAWNEDHDCQTWTRMNALATLAEIASPRLAEFIAEALGDPRPYLADFARRLRDGDAPR